MALDDAVHDRLRALSDEGTLRGALEIEAVWSEAEDVAVSAESYMGLVVRGLEELPLAPAPELEVPKEVLDQMDPRALKSATLLIRAAVHGVPDHVGADLDVGSEGSVEVHWRVEPCLIWVVKPPPMSWPCVRVRTYVQVDPHRPNLQVRASFLAHRVLEQALPMLRGAVVQESVQPPGDDP